MLKIPNPGIATLSPLEIASTTVSIAAFTAFSAAAFFKPAFCATAEISSFFVISHPPTK